MHRRLISARALASSGAAMLALTAAPAFAQDAARQPDQTADQDAQATNASGAADIVVTARRRSERLLDTPVAITAYTGAQLEKQGAVDITDLAETTPNVTLEASRGTNSTLTAFIRGVGQQDPVPGFEAGVGVYIDDVYLNRPQAALLDIYDVQRIEVLRGPQGTLYGRNTIGGAIKYVTARLPDQLSVKAKATYGSYNEADGVLTVSAPLSDMFRVGASVARLSHDGFGRNINLGIDNYNKDIWAARGTVEMGHADSNTFIRINGDYTHDKSNARNGHRIFPDFVTHEAPLKDVYDTEAGLNNPKEDVWSGGLAMTAQAELDDHVTLKSISAWRKDRSYTPIDFDTGPAADVDVPAVYRNEQVSQEFQLLYSSEKLNGIFGYYYLDAEASTAFDVLLYETVPGLNAYTAGDVRTNTSSFYGDFTYDFTDRLSLELGGRYTWDQRKAHILKQTKIGGSAEFGGNPLVIATQTDFRGKALFRRFTPRVSLNFKATPNNLFYASYSQGFKGGGFDPRGSAAAAPDANHDGTVDRQEVYDFLLFKPESVNSYEIGWKAALFDRRLTFALDGFYADYKDVQIPGSIGYDTDGDGVNDTFIGITTNAAKATLKGVEFEGNAILAQDFAGQGSSLSLAATAGYLDGKYNKYIDAFGNDVAKQRAIQNTPKWTASGTLAATLPVGPNTLDLSTTVAYRSKTHQFETAIPWLDQPAYALWDANLTYTFGDDHYSIGVHAKNILDKHYITSGYNYVTQNPDGTYSSTLGKHGVATAFYGNPRQVLLTATAKF
ncbi:MAG TPA: TonB-dependent receptor [Sphingomonas sp.]|nr:TonB-dependent receptor [Sphingomonas sp.]